jgi:hypothetical protein
MFEKPHKKTISIQDVYPDLTKSEQAEAEHNLRAYVRVVWRIYERLQRENPELLTKALKNDNFKILE